MQLLTSPVSRFQRTYVLSLAALWLAQTAARLMLFAAADLGSGVLPLIMHVLTALSFLCMLTLLAALLWLLPIGKGRGFLAALLFGAGHAAFTIFDIFHALFINLTGKPGPTWIIISDPLLSLSLLDNVGINPLMVELGLLALLAFHILLYAPVAGLLVSLANRLARQWIKVGRVAIPVLALLIAGWLSTQVVLGVVPPSVRAEMLEAIQPRWGIAPPDMLAAAGRGPEPHQMAPAPRAEGRPVVLIVVDALRSDRMGVYNPELHNTPFLSSLEAQGRLRKFEAYSTCTFSFCGIMSIVASRSWNDFGSRPETIIHRLTASGYKAHLVLAGEHLNFGGLINLLGRPIASVSDQPPREQPDDRSALKRLGALSIDDPKLSFLYLHLMSAHAGSFIEPPFRVTPDDTGKLGAYLFSPVDKAGYQQIYDGRVQQADDVIRRAFALLDRKGLLKDALVIVTADHGQRTSEGGLLYHGGEADPPTLKIPLLIYDARAGGYAAQGIVSQIDIAPTLARGAGIRASGGWKGLPLQLPVVREAVPVGTSGSTGMVARDGGHTVLYLCNRRNGHEQLIDMISGKPLEQAGITPRLRLLHQQAAAPVNDPACRR